MPEHHEILTHSPLREALFELRGPIGRPFSLVPGGLHPKIEADYPDPEELTPIQLASLLPADVGVISHRFRARDERGLVQLGPQVITINSLRYGGFQTFRSSIHSVLTGYFEVARPVTVQRLALRYINVFTPTSDSGGLALQINWPTIPRGTHVGLAARQAVRFEEPRGDLGVAIQLAPNPPETRLDLEFLATPGDALDLAAIMQWIDAAHDRTYDAFRAMVRPEQYAAWR